MNVIKTIDYVSEAFSFLTSMETNKSYKELALKQCRKHQKDANALFTARKDVFDFYEDLEKAFHEEFKKDKEQVSYYFGPLNNDNHWDSIGRILLLWEEYNHVGTKPVDAFAKDLLEMEETAYYRFFCRKLQSFDDTLRDSTQYSEPDTKEDAFRFILGSDFSMEDKLLFTEILVNHTLHIEKCVELLRRMIRLLTQYEDRILALYDWFTQYWSNVFGKEDPVQYFRTRSKPLATLPDNPFGHRITIEVCSPFKQGFSLSVDEDTGEYQTPYTMPMGILFCDEYPLVYSYKTESAHLDDEDYLSALKQICEKNRFEILTYIKEKESYGNEIASHLGLTTATVSHHTGLLNNYELIDISQIGSRIYFRSNKDTIRECIDFFRKKLL